jgi:hypothetical protein|tara:strand:+ start:277 stop:1926 length:1650 start_codon:yes stop_codon:yes gene_type:complete
MGLFKSAKRAVKKITKPISRVLDKVVPNEIKPALPYLAAIAPYAFGPGVVGASGFQGILANPIARASLAGGLNLGGQLAQEGSEGEFSGISTLLAGLQGFGTAAGADQYLQNLRTPMAGEEGFTGLGAIKSRAIDIGQKGVDILQGAGEVLRDPFNQGLGDIAKAGAIPFTQGSADLGIATARKALKDYELELDAFNALAGEQREASDEARRSAIIASMTRADFTQDIIDETLDQLGLKDGGIARLGFDNGGTPVFTKGSILKDKDVMRIFEDTDEAKSMISNFIKEERAPDVNEIIDFMKFQEKVGERVDKTADKISSRDDIAEIDPYGTFVFDEKGSLKKDEKGEFITDKSKIDARRREPVEILMSELMMKNKEKKLDKLGEEFMKMLKDKGLMEVFNKNQESAFTIMDILKEYKDKQLTKQADADSMLDAFGYGEIKRAEGDVNFGGIKEAIKGVAQNNMKEGMKKGGLASYKDGGIMNLGGKEMDMRTGGFIPIGAKERADDVPARLSKNEFVMTADAVRAAGGGSVNQGAKRMYDLMHNLEARA